MLYHDLNKILILLKKGYLVFKDTWNFIVDKIANSVIEGLAPYRDSSKTLSKQLPGYYGQWYLLSIPIFAAIYWMPLFVLHNDEIRVDEYFQFLYFSAITITTLGYGDITPINLPAMLLTGAHSVIGVGLIGLFLNALSHQHSEEAQQKEREKLAGDFRKTVSEIKAASKSMINQLTGGDSYPEVKIRQGKEEGKLNLTIRGHGKYSIREACISLCLINNGISYGEIIIPTVLPVRETPVCEKFYNIKEKKLNIELLITAANGVFVQQNMMRKRQDGSWAKAVQVLTIFPTKESIDTLPPPITLHIDDYYPRNKEGEVEWFELTFSVDNFGRKKNNTIY